MGTKRRIHLILDFVLLFALLCRPVVAGQSRNKDSKYLDAVREFADNVLKYGRDTYGPKHTPLFVDGLNVNTREPVKWRRNGEVWILSNLASQQNLFRTLDGLSAVTSDPMYKQAAMKAIEYAFENLRIANGLLYWGNWLAYDAQTDDVCRVFHGHILKHNYPYYELMWKVNPEATEQFIESFWSAHIVDWSNLDMNRIGSITEPLEKAWEHNYEGGPVFFKSKLPYGLSFHNTGSDLYYAGSLLHKLSGATEPLVWSKRLARRYVETRDPKVGISGQLYSQNLTNRAQSQFGDDFGEHLVHEGTLFPAMVLSPCSLTLRFRGWMCQFILGDLLGPDGTELTQWALEELTACGKVAYHKEDNSFVPMLTDGTSLVGYVLKKDGYYGPKGFTIHAMPAGPICFWAYALAYRVTGDSFMWEMARSIARGNNFGDIGASPTDQPDIDTDTESSDPYALLGFLELYAKLQKEPFLNIASRIGDNLLSERFYKGFFVPSNEALYAKFDYLEPLALLHLDAHANGRPLSVPQVWPSRSFFSNPYRGVQAAEDTFAIYGQTRKTELSTLLRVAARAGNVAEVETLISRGVDVNANVEFDSRVVQRIFGAKESLDIALEQKLTDATTPLHLAAEKGHKDVVELLVAKGADIGAKDTDGDTPLHSAAGADHRDVAELLIANGADLNVKNNDGRTPLDVALSQRHNDIAKLLVEAGADIPTIHMAAFVGSLDELRDFAETGTDIDTKDENGRTPLLRAVMGRHINAVRFLIECGAEVNIRDAQDYVPLMYAIWTMDSDMVRLLVDKGADVKAKDAPSGYTSLHWAVMMGSKELTELILEAGGDVNAESTTGETALDLAKQGGREIAELLRKHGAME
ncbi:MAG: ankyrin repeat domain-containing protein [Planctomycetota bacterium]|jgi:pectate lyase